MAGNKSGDFVLTHIPEETQKVKRVLGFTEQLGIKDENAGDKIKDAADKAGLLGSFCALIIAFLIWNQSNDVTGFLIGFLIAGAGIGASYVLMLTLYSVGDVITISIDQMKILKRLEAKKVADLVKANIEEYQGENAESGVSETASTANSLNEKPAVTIDDSAGDPSAPALTKAEEKKKKAELPGTIVAFDRMKRIVRYNKRPDSGLICPICKRKQSMDYDTCYYCGCVYIFDDEQK